jgi:hypothetical protein
MNDLVNRKGALMSGRRDEFEARNHLTNALTDGSEGRRRRFSRRSFLARAAATLSTAILAREAWSDSTSTGIDALGGPLVAGNPGPIWSMGASELADRIRARKLSSREVVDAFLERIDAVNGQVNAITVVLAASAREAAEHADGLIARGMRVGPLHGVPFTVKENIEMVGSATTQGLVALANLIPTRINRTSPNSKRPVRSRSPGRTSPTSQSVGTRTTSCTVPRSTRGMPLVAPAVRVAATRRRSPPA